METNASVTAEVRVLINLGNYENIEIAFSESLPCEPNKTDEASRIAFKNVMNRAQKSEELIRERHEKEI